MSTLVTGGGGMLAAAFKKLLPHAHFAPRDSLDITDEKSVRKIFDEVRPKILINCAAYTKVDLAEQNENEANAINGHALKNLAKLCGEHDTTLVHFSTDYVFE